MSIKGNQYLKRLRDGKLEFLTDFKSQLTECELKDYLILEEDKNMLENKIRNIVQDPV